MAAGVGATKQPAPAVRREAEAPTSTKVDCEESVYVYELPIRIWHWVTVLGLAVLFATGLLIAYPLPSSMGEASDYFLMGYIRETHYIAGYIIAIAFAARVYWAFVGNSHARQIFFIPITKREYWRGVWNEIRWYTFTSHRPERHIDHNPLARLAMFSIFILPLVLMIVTGMALFAEGQADGHVVRTLFGWMSGMFTGMELRFMHHVGMWLIVLFTLVHLYTTVREDIMGRTSTISSIISGRRYLKDDDE